MCHQRKDYRRKYKFYTCYIGKHSHDIYCSSPYYDRNLLDVIIIKQKCQNGTCFINERIYIIARQVCVFFCLISYSMNANDGCNI